MRRIGLLLIVVSVTTVTGVHSAAQSPQARLRGAWRVVEASTSQSTPTTAFAPPSVYLFTDKHFSFVAVSTTASRPAPADPANVTGTEALALWGPFMAQAGTYDTSGTTLTVRAIVAKNPAAMVPGGSSTYSYRLDGDTLTLTLQQGAALAAVLKLTRLE